MPLYPTGDEARTLSGINYGATDQDNAPATVAITHEALQDFGFDAAWPVASDKYDRKRFERKNDRPIVKVTTTDMKQPDV
jgi:hypothetical protein